MNKDPLDKYKYKDRLELKDLKPELIEIKKICCPSCAKPAASEDLNIQTNIAKCTSCDVIFSFTEQVEQLSTQHSISQEVLQPEGVELSRYRDELDISVEQPWGVMEIILISFLPLLVLMITSMVIELVPSTNIAKIGLISFWIASIIGYFSYFFIRKRHKIYVHIDDLNLHIERRPRKLIRDKQYANKDIDQVYIKNVANSNGAKGIGIFMIVNSAEGQKHVELIKSVSSRSKAKYIEQEIERQLGIADRRVPDEDA